MRTRLIIGALLAAIPYSCSDRTSEQEYFTLPATDTWILPCESDASNFQSCWPSNSASIPMARGEYEHVQVIIKTGNDEPLAITCDSGKGADTFDVTSRHFGTFDGMEDILVPCNGSADPKDGIARIWVTLKSPDKGEAGKYEKTLHFAGKDTTYSIRFSIELADVTIPRTPSIPCVFGVNPASFRFDGLNDGQRTEKRREALELLLDYRMSPYLCTWLPASMKVECTSSPYDVSDSRCWEFLSDERFAAIALPSHNLDDSRLKAMLDEAKNRGVLDKAFFYVWDEPTMMTEYAQIRTMADRIHAMEPSARILTTYYCGPKDGDRVDDLYALWDILNGATNIFCTGVWSLQSNEGRAAQCISSLRDGQEWWTYVCMGDYPGLAFNSAGVANRAVMWRSWKERNTGFLYWAVNAFSSMDPLSKRPELPQGDGLLLFPGEAFGTDGFCVSARLERWRDGQEDYELLKLLEEKNGRNAAEEVLGTVYRDPQQFTNTEAELKAFKKALLGMKE